MDSVFIPIPIEKVEEAPEITSKTYRLDLDNGRICGIVDGLPAVEQAIRKAIITPRFACLIYNSQYGSEIESAFIEKDASMEYIKASVEGYVRDALLPDTRILSVSDFEVEFTGDNVQLSFYAETIFGPINISEVVTNV